MNDKNKNRSFNKKLVKDRKLKFSNTVLFERRERNYNSEENNMVNIKKAFNKTHKLFRKKINKKTKENLAVQFYKTMSSFYQPEKTYNILPLLDYFEKNIKTKKKKKIHLDNLICKTERNYREKDLFKTEISCLTNKNNKKSNKYYLRNKNNDKENFKNYSKKDSNIDILLLFQSERNQNKESNIRNPKLNIESYLTKGKTNYNNYPYVQTEQNKNLWDKTSDEYANYVFDIKSSKFEHNLNYKDFINKLKEEKIIIHTTKAKTERLKRLEEASTNQIEFYEDSIASFINSKRLLENNFVNKVGDYSRYISTKREREKIKQSLLRQKIMDLRKEIEQIRAKINKIEIEKKNIIKWIFLQIQMKEKILKIPQHYKNIITNYGTNQSSKKLLLRSDDKEKDSSSEHKKSYKKAILKIKDSFALKFFKTKDSFNIFSGLGNDEKSTEKRNIRIREHKRILSYKNNLIYKTPDEFNDRLASLEKGNLILLQYKDSINSQLFKYKRELESLINERNKFEIENQKIAVWENELKIIKKMAKENMKKVSLFKMNRINNMKTNVEKYNNEKDEKLKSNINAKDDDKYKYKTASLFKSIYILFQSCQNVETNLKSTSEILNQVDRKMNTKEKEMLLMLEFIEQTADYLIMSINKKMNQSNEIKNFIKTIKSNIEKEHKLEKAKLQMLLDIKKSKLLQEKVSKRYNKIYFLPKRKTDLYEFKIKKEKTSSNKRIYKKDNIQDYLYDEESSKE